MDDQLLISLVQKYEFLYNKRLPDFKDIAKKRHVWHIIAKKLNVKVEDCMKHWTYLRDRYVRKTHEYINTDIAFCDWHLYESLTFLDPHVKSRKRKSIKTDYAEHELEDDFIAPTMSSPIPFKKVKTRRSSSPEFSNQLTAIEFIESFSPPQLNDNMPEMSAPSAQTEQSTSPFMVKAFLETVNCFKQIVETHMVARNSAVESFGHMIVATINEMSPAKQAVAINEVTHLIMNLKNEPDENYEQN